MRIDSFEGKREILSPEGCPAKYSKDEALRVKLVNRGKYMSILQRNAPQCQYKGFAFAKQDADRVVRERVCSSLQRAVDRQHRARPRLI